MRALLLLAGFLTVADEPTPSAFVGYWYGENYQPTFHEYFQELDVHRADGTFEVEFRKYTKCKLVFDQHEAGTWSMANGVVHMLTLSINAQPARPTTNPLFTDDYQLIVLDEHNYEERQIGTGATFKLWRVTEKFKFPDCTFTS